jgi:hypothetical protein
VYLQVQDGADVERFLRALHERCWLAGLGWMMVGAAGQLLERSVIDRMVGGPERLVFEGGPVLEPPLQQDRESRRPVAVRGDALDTLAACPPLSIGETAKLDELRARARQRLKPEAARVRAAFIRQARASSANGGLITSTADSRAAVRWHSPPRHGVDLDDEEFKGCTAADVPADPARFEGATFTDPLEVSKNPGRKSIHRRTAPMDQLRPRGVTYQLKYNAAAVRRAIERGDADFIEWPAFDLTKKKRRVVATRSDRRHFQQSPPSRARDNGWLRPAAVGTRPRGPRAARDATGRQLIQDFEKTSRAPAKRDPFHEFAISIFGSR